MSGASDRRRPGEQCLFGLAEIRRDKVRDFSSIEHINVDPHEPGQFRTHDSLRNRFVDAFGVKADDPRYLPPGRVFRAGKPGARWLVPTPTGSRPADRHEFSGDINSLEALQKPSKVPFWLA